MQLWQAMIYRHNDLPSFTQPLNGVDTLFQPALLLSILVYGYGLDVFFSQPGLVELNFIQPDWLKKIFS